MKNWKKWRKTPFGRASILVSHYIQEDKKHNRGKGDLTAQWVEENILSKPCAHCGKTGWDVIGCNRLDNSKPHTMDNVEPCCKECNDKEYIKKIKIPVYQYTLDGEFIKKWNSAPETGYDQSSISRCCNGKYKTAFGYRWSYKPLNA